TSSAAGRAGRGSERDRRSLRAHSPGSILGAERSRFAGTPVFWPAPPDVRAPGAPSAPPLLRNGRGGVSDAGGGPPGPGGPGRGAVVSAGGEAPGSGPAARRDRGGRRRPTSERGGLAAGRRP